MKIQIQVQILALVHRLDNGVKGGKSGKILAGKATKAAELVNLVGPWAANNPPHCKHLFVKELEHKIPGKSTLLNSFQEF